MVYHAFRLQQRLIGLFWGVGETDEEFAKRLQAAYDDEAGIDSHKAVRAGSQPSQALPSPSTAQGPSAAQVTNVRCLSTAMQL